MKRYMVPLALTQRNLENFFGKVVPGSDEADCWTWLGAFHPTNGYAVMWACGNTRQAHRISYVIANGEIADGMVLDHLCRNRGCVNPRHLEAVTDDINLKRSSLTLPGGNILKTSCPQGHSYDRVTSSGRRCSTCHRMADRAYKARKRMAA